jgi:hypothetical protein
MRARQLILSAALAAAVVAVSAQAEPYLMVRSGAKCNDCHTNVTGGGKRTAFPYIHSHEILKDLQILPLPARARAFDGQIHSHVSIGGDFRVRDTTVFTDEPDSNGKVPRNRAFRSDVESNDLDVNEFLLYLNIDLWPEVLSIYADEDFDGGATNREAFGLLRGVFPLDGYVKAGRLYPVYGLRIHDDQAYIRSRTGYTFENPDEGVELGIMPGPYYLGTSITDGQEGDTDVQVTVNASAVLEDLPVVGHTLVGTSYGRQSDKRWVGSFYAGANLWNLTYLAEFDYIDDRTPQSLPARDKFAAYAEVNWLFFGWLNARGAFDFVKVAGDRDQTRYVVGLEPFIDKFLQPRLQYRINNGPPNNPEQNRDELVLELHLWF